MFFFFSKLLSIKLDHNVMQHLYPDRYRNKSIVLGFNAALSLIDLNLICSIQKMVQSTNKHNVMIPSSFQILLPEIKGGYNLLFPVVHFLITSTMSKFYREYCCLLFPRPCYSFSAPGSRFPVPSSRFFIFHYTNIRFHL